MRYLSSWANIAKQVKRNNVVSGGPDRKYKLQADDADIQQQIEKNKHNWIGGGEGQRMLANKIATYNQLLFFVFLFHIRMIVRRNHLNKKTTFSGQLLRILLLPNIHKYDGLPNTDNR